MYKPWACLLALCLISGQVLAKQPSGWFYPIFIDREPWEEYRIDISARVQAGVQYNDNGSSNLFPSGFFNINEGLILNRAEVLIERPLDTVYKPGVGPFPGSTPDKWDWGFLVQARYGEDFNPTYGFDDELDINDGESSVVILPQWFIKGYAPIGRGMTWQLGTWFTNIGNEIGAPTDPPSPFYSHAYAMMYGPSKHFGGLVSARLPVDPEYGLWGVEVGVVQGWNNLQDNNDEKTYIAALQWRSPDMKTWVDVESVFGNEQAENALNDQSPFVAVSSNSENLFRQFHSLTLSHQFTDTPQWRVVLNGVYGSQEGGDVAVAAENPPGFLITEDSEWYGINGSLLWQVKSDLQLGLRVEWFEDKQGAYFLLPAGEYNAVTVNASWYPEPWLRIRPELRFDRYEGMGAPFGGELPAIYNGRETEQTLFSVDATIFL